MYFTGEELLNVSGVVRFVGKVGKKTSSSPTYVGLKLDQPCKSANIMYNHAILYNKACYELWFSQT